MVSDRTTGVLGAAAILLALAVAGACGERAPAEQGEEASAEAADTTGDATLGEAAEEALPGRSPAALPVTFHQAPIGFPHDPHRQISCTRCHGAIEGHATHQTVGCSECHNVPEDTEATSLPSRAECLACHHRPRQGFTCSRCHETTDIGWVQVSQRLEMASSSTSRRLPFLHERHEEVECRTCHTDGPGLDVGRSCSSCHEEHHRQKAACLTCHASVPLDTHELRSHEGCSGSGCHQDPVVPSLQLTRNVCLSCHQDQVDHERGEECASCHLVTQEASGREEDGP